MSLTPRDPLLTIAKLFTQILIGITGFVAVMLLIAAPVAIFFQDSLVAEFAKEGVRAGAPLVQPIAILLLSCAALMAFIAWFLICLLRMIDSVKVGDPFIPLNADRLARMAWITIAIQLVIIPLFAWGRYLDRIVANNGQTIRVQFDYQLDFGTVILVLMLFILARVFRHGAAMREDLEGTV